MRYCLKYTHTIAETKESIAFFNSFFICVHIALTEYVSDYLDAHIGDKITINMNGEDKEFIVTGYFQCMNNLGKNARLNNKIKLDYCDFVGGMGYQIEFDDDPSDKVIAERIDKMKDIFGTKYKYMTAGEFVDECTRKPAEM